jgi:hypothetical protein
VRMKEKETGRFRRALLRKIQFSYFKQCRRRLSASRK